MRKVFVSTLVLSMSMGIMYDVSAQRNRASGITSRTARAVNRGGSSSQSSSSTTNVDITTITQRFKNTGYDSEKLYYDKEYELQDFLTSATYNYYYNNGSNSINEQLCFGPYMFVNKNTNTNNTNYMDYIGVEKSEAKRTCIDIMPNITYTIGLIPASDSAVETASAEGRYLTIQNNNSPSPNIKKLLSTEKYVDVSEYAKSITDTFNNVKTYCGNYNENMDKVRTQLGTVLFTSLGGTALSAGATAVNVLNVKKTEEIGKDINKIQENIANKPKNVSKKEQREEAFKNFKLEDHKEAANLIDKAGNYNNAYKAKREAILQKIKDVIGTFDFINSECSDDDIKKMNDIGFPEICNVEQRMVILKDKGLNDECVGAKIKDPFYSYCMNDLNSYAEYDLYPSPNSGIDVNFDCNSLTSDNVAIADVDGGKSLQELKEICQDAIIAFGNFNLGNLFSTEKPNENTKLADKIEEGMESKAIMDWANVVLSGASTVASGVSIGFSVAAINNVKEALENLEKCQKSLTELKTTFAEYNAEIEAEEGE